METVHDLAARGHDWKYYDENYHFLCQSDASNHPRGNIHMELWLKSFLNSRPRVSASNSSMLPQNRSQPRLPIPAGYCYNFCHKGLDCSGCSFKHECFKCNKGNHKALNCNFRGSTTNQSNTKKQFPSS